MTKDFDFKGMENRWRPFGKSIDLYRTGDEVERP
jgi:hypothetical protein